MGVHDQTLELIALAVLRNAVRCRDLQGLPLTYRRSLPGIVPGQRLTIGLEKRWRFRKTDMVGGPLLHAGFSLRALSQAGFGLPRLGALGLAGPGDGDARVHESRLALEAGDWTLARCLLLEILEEHPACLQAHAILGNLLADLEHRETALAHLTAAIRLGLGATCSDDRALPLDATRPTERDLLGALACRARLLQELGRTEDAASDLRRALAWDPGDVMKAAPALDALERVQESAVPLPAEAGASA